MAHEHEIKHHPASGSGVGVCACGATVGVLMGRITGIWHACALCVAGWGK